MKRIAQTQNTYNDDSAEQSVMLSPRTLLTGPRQIVRLERQYRSLSEDLQNSLENLNRTKDSYVNALHTFEQAEEYIRQLGPRVRMAVTLLNNAQNNPEYLTQAEAMIESITTPMVQEKTSHDTHTMVKLAQNAGQGAMLGGSIGQSTNNTPTQITTTTPTTNMQQTAISTQQVSALQARLSTFVNEMHRRYSMHKQRAIAMESQYNMSKVAYAKVRATFFQMQTEISSLAANLSGWNERLGEYYAPEGGEA